MRHSVFLIWCVALTLTGWTSAPAWAADTRLGGHDGGHHDQGEAGGQISSGAVVHWGCGGNIRQLGVSN